MALIKQAVLASAVLAAVLGGALADTACWWTQAGICRLRSDNMMPELRTALVAKLERNGICVSHSTETGCAAGAPDNCKTFKLTSLTDDESAEVCADASAQFESLEDYKTAVEAGPAFQELCFTADGYVTWACMRDLSLLSKFLGCANTCAANVLTLEKMHQTCAAAKDAASCTGAASESAKAFAANGAAAAALPKEAVPAAGAEKVIRSLAGSYGGYTPPPMTMTPPPSPLNTIESGLSPTPIGNGASAISVGVSVLGALVAGVVMLAF